MGLTVLEIEVGNPSKSEIMEKIEFVIDSGIFLDPLKRELDPMPMILAETKDE